MGRIKVLLMFTRILLMVTVVERWGKVTGESRVGGDSDEGDGSDD